MLILATAAPAAAHHGWSGYDTSEVVELTGSIEEVSFANPHATIMLRTADKLWEIVLAPPSRMTRRGLPNGSLETGQEVSVEGYRHQTDEDEFRAERIRVNGTSTELR